MKYLCLTVHGTSVLESIIADRAQEDWRLHTLTYLGTVVDHGVTLASWHVVMEKGI